MSDSVTHVPIYRKAEKLSPLETYAQQIWNTLFHVSIRFRDTLTEDHIRMFGMPTVGDAQLDADMHNQPITTYHTINTMVELFRQGITVSLLNRADAKPIYDIVEGYLKAWKMDLDVGINIGDAPIDDLVLLDQFAQKVYPFAQEQFTEAYLHSRFLNHMSGNGRFASRTSFHRKAEEQKVIDRNEEPKVAQRESMGDIFRGRVNRMGDAPNQARPFVEDSKAPMPRWQRGKG